MTLAFIEFVYQSSSVHGIFYESTVNVDTVCKGIKDDLIRVYFVISRCS